MKYKVWYDEERGILCSDIVETFDVESATGFFNAVKDFEPEKQRYFLVYLAEGAQPLPDRETRRTIREKAAGVNWGKLALIGVKPALKMVARIVMTAAGKAKDTMFFSTEEEALAWLEEEKKKSV